MLPLLIKLTYFLEALLVILALGFEGHQGWCCIQPVRKITIPIIPIVFIIDSIKVE